MPTPEPTVTPVRNVDAGHYRNLLLDAARFVIGRQAVTPSIIQRHVRVGFAMAGRLLTLLEDAGVVGPALTSGPRKVLVAPDQRDAVLALLAEEVSDG